MAKVLDVKGMSSRQINNALKILASSNQEIIIRNPEEKHHIAAGLSRKVTITLEGSVGYFVGTMIDGAHIQILGNAGWFAGDNMTSGNIFINGHVGNGAGQGICGGTIVIRGDSGERTGSLMKQGVAIIGGNTSIMTGLYMMGGEIIVLGDLGEYAGESIIGGQIVFAGEVRSLGKNAKLAEMAEVENDRIKRLLEIYGYETDNLSFQKIVPKGSRPFYKHREKVRKKLTNRTALYNVMIDRTLCNGCRVCVGVCPQGVLGLIKDRVTPVNEAECVACEVCRDYCKMSAIKVIPISFNLMSTWNKNTIKNIENKALSGHHSVRGMGARRTFPHFDDLVILCAQTSRPPIDHYREPCETETVIGARFAEKPLSMKAPIIIGAMSFGAISKEAKIAIAKASSKLGLPVNTGEGGMLPEERENSKLLIAQYASGRFGVSAHYLRSADAVEIKIGQGAKGGQGGLLLGEKVIGDVAAVRKIPVGTDAVSPARHLDIVGPEDLKMKIEQLREITEWKVPIIVKYSAGRVPDDVKIAAKAGADIIVVDGKQGGTGAAPEVVLEHAGIPSLPALVEANRALKQIGLRDEVDLVISGGIRNGADIAKALALGADAVAMSTAILIAMGCRACRLCSTGKCPKGITTQNPNLRRRFKVEDAARMVENFLNATIEELEMLAQLSGKTSIRNFEAEDLRALSVDAASITGVKLMGTT